MSNCIEIMEGTQDLVFNREDLTQVFYEKLSRVYRMSNDPNALSREDHWDLGWDFALYHLYWFFGPLPKDYAARDTITLTFDGRSSLTERDFENSIQVIHSHYVGKPISLQFFISNEYDNFKTIYPVTYMIGEGPRAYEVTKEE